MNEAGARDPRIAQELRRADCRQCDRFPPGARRPARADRPERRRQDDLCQSRYRAPCSRAPGGSISTAPTSPICRKPHGSSAASSAPFRSRAVRPPECPRERDPCGPRAARARGGLFRPAGHHRAAIEEAHTLLERLGIADEALRPVTCWPMAVSGWSRSRWRSPLVAEGPAARRAGGRGSVGRKRGRSSKSSSDLPADIALLIIEHDINLVFRLAQRITVLVQGSILVEGPPEAIAADPGSPQGLSRGAHSGITRGPVTHGLGSVGVRALERPEGADADQVAQRDSPVIPP